MPFAPGLRDALAYICMHLDAHASSVGRLAPSPTGPLHLGHARSFLIAWWHARQTRGRIVLRLEDLDRQRCTTQFRDLVRTDLEWLGIDWDGQEWVQSERLEVYAQKASQLLEQGLAYPCVCSRSDVQAAVSAPHAGEVNVRYPGTCRYKYTSLADAERRTGKTAGLRVVAPDESLAFIDNLAGPVSQNVARDVGDFLILRRDKIPSYQLAVVVDDAAQGVSAVVRGADLLDSTPRQIFLAQALNASIPAYFHVPLVVDAQGRRLAKRSRDLSLHELRCAGIDPRRIVQWVAQSCAMHAPEPALAAAFVAHFDMQAIPLRPVVVPPAWCGT